MDRYLGAFSKTKKMNWSENPGHHEPSISEHNLNHDVASAVVQKGHNPMPITENSIQLPGSPSKKSKIGSGSPIIRKSDGHRRSDGQFGPRSPTASTGDDMYRWLLILTVAALAMVGIVTMRYQITSHLTTPILMKGFVSEFKTLHPNAMSTHRMGPIETDKENTLPRHSETQSGMNALSIFYQHLRRPKRPLVEIGTKVSSFLDLHNPRVSKERLPEWIRGKKKDQEVHSSIV